MEPLKATSVNSRAEELFVQLFCEASVIHVTLTIPYKSGSPTALLLAAYRFHLAVSA